MKSIFALSLLTLSLQSSAFVLKVNYGKLSVENGKHACTFVNNTGRDLYVKRVEFDLVRNINVNFESVESVKFNNVIYAGEEVSVTSKASIGQFRAFNCKFLSK